MLLIAVTFLQRQYCYFNIRNRQIILFVEIEQALANSRLCFFVISRRNKTAKII